MHIKDFMDLSKLQEIQDKFSTCTGLAAIAMDTNGEYLTKGSNFTDFLHEIHPWLLRGKQTLCEM